MDAVSFIRDIYWAEPLLFAFLLIVLEVPRYTLSAAAMLLASLSRSAEPRPSSVTVTAIVPAFNGEAGLANTLDSLLDGMQNLAQIIVVNDGSTDGTRRIVEMAAARDGRIRALHHAQRTGKSAAINHAANLATSELIVVVDVDTVPAHGAVCRLAEAFHDGAVAAACGNITVLNAGQNPLSALQSLEYLTAISVGRGFMDYLGSVGCCSGAFSMFRRDAFLGVGGMKCRPRRGSGNHAAAAGSWLQDTVRRRSPC